nr:MAG: hypothetical protein [Bacteriophage sp.]
MLTFSYGDYMGFIGYLCAYTHKRRGKKERNTSRREKERKTKERSIK